MTELPTEEWRTRETANLFLGPIGMPGIGHRDDDRESPRRSTHE